MQVPKLTRPTDTTPVDLRDDMGRGGGERRKMSMRRSTLAAVFVSVLVWWWPASALAQSRATSADLTGTVRDDSQAVVPGARVTARNLETNLERDAVTRADGRFLLAAVPLGMYRVHIDLTGFATIVLERVELALGASVDVDVVLHPAAIAEAIRWPPSLQSWTRAGR